MSDKTGFDAVQYRAVCKAMIDEFIEKSTRFDSGGIIDVNATVSVVDLPVFLNFDFKFVPRAWREKGVSPIIEGDLVATSQNELESYVQQVLGQESKRQQTTDDFLASMMLVEYGSINDAQNVRKYPGRVYHEHDCDRCSAEGQITCPGCRGAGIDTCPDCSGSGERSCSHCSGSGNRQCSSCYGSGSKEESRSVRQGDGSYRYQTVRVKCGSCFGRGGRTCDRCGGRGKRTCGKCSGHGTITCPSCSGLGKITCPECDGKYYVTDLVQVETIANPSYTGRYSGLPASVQGVVEKVGITLLASIASHIELQGSSNHLNQPSIYYRIKIPFCEMQIMVRDKNYQVVIYGEQPTIYSTDNILEDLIKGDLDNFHACVESGVKWMPWFHRPASSRLRVLFESEVVEAICSHAAKGKDAEKIAQEVNHSVSREGIANFLKSTDAALTIAGIWSRLKSLFFLVLTILPISLLLTVQIFYQEVGSNLGNEVPQALPKLQDNMLLVTAGYAFLVFVFGKFLSRRWQYKAGGNTFVSYAKRERTLFGFMMFVVMIGVAVAAVLWVLPKFPVKVAPFGKIELDLTSVSSGFRLEVPRLKRQASLDVTPSGFEATLEWVKKVCQGGVLTDPAKIDALVGVYVDDKKRAEALYRTLSCIHPKHLSKLPVVDAFKKQYMKNRERQSADRERQDNLAKKKILGRWRSVSCAESSYGEHSCNRFAGLVITYGENFSHVSLADGRQDKKAFSLNEFSVQDNRLVLSGRSEFAFIDNKTVEHRWHNLVFRMVRD